MTDSGTFRNHELDPRTALDSLTRIFGSGIHSGSGIHPPPPPPLSPPPQTAATQVSDCGNAANPTPGTRAVLLLRAVLEQAGDHGWQVPALRAISMH